MMTEATDLKMVDHCASKLFCSGGGVVAEGG